MADVLKITQLTPGTIVRITVSPLANSSIISRRSFNNGLFRVLEGGAKHSINQREWRKIVGVSRHKFIARIIENDPGVRLLTVHFLDPKAQRERMCYPLR